jgi:hypothetical protein
VSAGLAEWFAVVAPDSRHDQRSDSGGYARRPGPHPDRWQIGHAAERRLAGILRFNQ